MHTMLEAMLAEGRRLHDERRFDEALATYARILKASPAHPHALYEAALTLRAKGDTVRARSLLERVVSQPGQVEFAFVLLGAIHDQHGEFAQGEAVFRRGLMRFGDDAPLRFSLGVNLLAQHQASAALPELIRNLALRPVHPRGWAIAGDALWENQLWAWALLAWGRALVLRVDDVFAKRTADRLWHGWFAGLSPDRLSIRVPASTGEDAAMTTAENLAVAASAVSCASARSETAFLSAALDSLRQALRELHSHTVVASRRFWHGRLLGPSESAQVVSAWLAARA
ncbi:MAG: tetratricopeptide repeat protein [Myxococcaceae bacterium]|nr:tetratricopeptide repeat protein [Myxococcaceae bacterium]